jgi:hypothetical protein
MRYVYWTRPSIFIRDKPMSIFFPEGMLYKDLDLKGSVEKISDG